MIENYLTAIEAVRTTGSFAINLPFFTATPKGPCHSQRTLTAEVVAELAAREPAVEEKPKKRGFWPFGCPSSRRDMSMPAAPFRAHALVLLALASGCFPYRETYRPAITGRVVDERGAPVAGAPVETCSTSRWSQLRGECPRRATTVSAADGTFRVSRQKETEWCCLGEAPLPFTVVSVCMPDGRLGGASFDSTKDPVAVTIPIAPPSSMSVVQPRPTSAARSHDPGGDVKQRCQASSEGR